MAVKVMQGGKAQFYEFLREAIRSDAEAAAEGCISLVRHVINRTGP